MATYKEWAQQNKIPLQGPQSPVKPQGYREWAKANNVPLKSEQPSALQEFAQSIANPFKKAATSVVNTIEATGQLGGAGIAKVLGKDDAADRLVKQAGQTATKERDFGYLGTSRPLGINQETGENLPLMDAYKDIIGSGLEGGSYFAPAGVLGKGAKGASFLNRLKGFGKLGAAEGATFSAGAELQRPESTAGSVLGEGLKGAAAGVLVGTAIPILGSTIRGTGRGISKITKLGAEQVQERIPDTLRYGVSQATGLTPESIESIIRNPNRYTADKLANINRQTITESVAQKLLTKLDDLAGLGKEYDTIRAIQQRLPLEFTKRGIHKPLDEMLNQFGLDLVGGRVVRTKRSVPMERGDLRDIQTFVDLFGHQQIETGGEFLNMRQQLDLFSNWASDKIGVSEQFARLLRQKYDEIGKRTYQGLEQLDKEFSPIVNELKAVVKEIGDPRKQIKDVASSRLANLLNENNFQRLQRIKKVIPDIEDDVRDLRVVEDLAKAEGQKVGTYARAVLTGGAVLSGNIPFAVLSWVLTTPKNIISVLRKYAEISQKPGVKKIIDKISKKQRLTKTEEEVVSKAVQETYNDFKMRVLKENLAGKGAQNLLPAPDQPGRPISPPLPKDPSRSFTQEEILEMYPQYITGKRRELLDRLSGKGPLMLKGSDTIRLGPTSTENEMRIRAAERGVLGNKK